MTPLHPKNPFNALPAIAALLSALLLSNPSAAATCNWLGGSGDWHTPAKWSCGQVPTSADDVSVTLGGGISLTVNAPAPAKTLVINTGSNVGGSGMFDVAETATFGTYFNAVISTVGSRLPAVTWNIVDSSVVTLTDPALTADSLQSLTVARPNGGSGALALNIGARDIGTLNVLGGALSLPAPLTVTAQLTWNGGSVTSSTQQALTLASGATGTLQTANFSTAFVNRGTLTVNGVASLIASGTTSFVNHGTLDIRLAAQTAVNTFNAGQQFGGSGLTFVNYGSVLFNHTGTLAFYAQSEFSNHGSVQFNSGTVYLSLTEYRQYAGMTQFNGGNVAGTTKCCSLDNSSLTLKGGILAGGGAPLYDVVGGIENDGGTLLLNGALRVSNLYTQTARGSVAVTINGTNAGSDFGTLTVVSRPGFNSAGNINLAGNLIVDRGPAFTPRSGDRFTIMTAEGNVSGGTSGGSGSMYPAFAAFAGAAQVTVAEPAQALLVQAKADQPSSLAGGSNGYTVQLVNPTQTAIGVSAFQVTMPIDFSYVSGSSTGITTVNPFGSTNGTTRDLFWFLPATVSIPAGGTRTLHFNIDIAASVKIARQRIGGNVTGPGGLSASFSGAAPIDIKVSSAISSTTVTISGGSGTIQSQGGTQQLLLRSASVASTVIGLRTRISCPPEYQPCGNLRTVFVGQWLGGRYYNVHQLTLDPDQSEPMAAPPSSSSAMRAIAMRATSGPAPVKAQAGDDYGFWKGQIPGSGVIPGVPQKIFPDWDNHRPCIAFNGDGNGLYPVGCVGGDGDPGGGGGGGGDGFGTPQLYDPSGIISDATTGLPISGATVTLYRQIPGLPDTSTLTRQCRTIDTRGGAVWTGTAPDTGVFEQPGFMPAQMSPDVNPQITGADGRYGWNVVTGCWYVKVSAPGYASKISALVGVPPEVTDLHLALQPVTAGPVNLVRVVSRKLHGAIGSFDLPVDTTAGISGPVSVEPRAIGAGHAVVFEFDGPVVSVSTTGVTGPSSANIGSHSTAIDGNQVVVTLENIPDAQRVRVTLSGVNGASSAAAALGFLVGDVNGSRAISSGDLSSVRAQAGQSANNDRFRYDLNATGTVSAADIATVKARIGRALP